jgi:hypothetical protein
MLASIFVALVGASGPRWRGAGGSVKVVIDRGITMSADERLAEVRERATKELLSRGITDIRVTFVPDGTGPDGEEGTAARASPLQAPAFVAFNTREVFENARDASAVYLTDHALKGVAQIAPSAPVENVGIVSLAARATPKAQVMVRVRNQSRLTNVQLTITSGDVSRSQQIQLRANGDENYFVDLPALRDVVEGRIDAKDDLPIDNVAWLVRTRAWPRIEILDTLPPELQRMIEVYRKNRPAGTTSPTIAITTSPDRLSASMPGIVVGGGNTKVGSANLNIVPHELTRDIDWKAIAAAVSIGPNPNRQWKPLVSAGDRVLLAVRDESHQALVNFDTRAIAGSPQFVVLWAKLLDWAGGGGEVYASEPVHQIDSSWRPLMTDPASGRYAAPRPGVYKRTDGALLAMNAIDIVFPPPVQTDLSALNRVANEQTHWIALRPALLVGAAVLLVLALACMQMKSSIGSHRRASAVASPGHP